MNPITHPIEPEELMAYLDGELEQKRKTTVKEHLDRCAACQISVADLNGVSNAIKAWEVEHEQIPSPLLTAALADRPSKSGGFTKWIEALRSTIGRRWVPVGLAALALVLYIASSDFNGHLLLRARRTTIPQQAVELIAPESDAPSPNSVAGGGGGGDRDKFMVSRKSGTNAVRAASERSGEGFVSVSGPKIIRTAQLTLITKDFEKARDSVESILRRHRGYLADLKVGGSTGSGRNLTGTLRVPADQLDSTLTELKTLGRVETESQSGQDVTSQYVDLEARLTNARHTEQRLTDLLRNRTGKLSDVLEVEQELSRVRGEIEQMEAERKNMANQVTFATVNLTVAEDYKAQLQVVPPSTSTRLQNAAVQGYRNVVEGALSFALFMLSTGPTLLAWAAILFIPARFAWRKLRHGVAQ